MKPTRTLSRPTGLLLGALIALLAPPASQTALAQTSPSQRVIRTYIPPDQLVSFLPSTPFPQFVEFLNPIFKRVAGKQIVDPESRAMPINIAISGMHFLDAFELVLEYQGLTYRETEQYFIVEPVPPAAVGAVAVAGPAPAGPAVALPTTETREVRINATLFDLNLNKAREVGFDWNVLFGDSAPGSGEEGYSFVLSSLSDRLDGVLNLPDDLPISTLTQVLRAFESVGLGNTVAHPQITVQSGEQGRIQIGSDVPVQTRDFAGNTVTQFFATGTIVDVTPTLIRDYVGEDTSDGQEPIDFVHMDVRVEKSAGRPSAAGITIDRNQATTQVLLLPGEQTVIGGLYSTEEVTNRRGVPILKDLPGWFFGLRYVFGYTSRTVIQREMLIVLEAEVLETLDIRARRPLQNNGLRQRNRRETIEKVRTIDEEAAEKLYAPEDRPANR